MSPPGARRPATGFVLAALVIVAALAATPGCTPLEPRVRNVTGSSRRGVYHVVHKGETLWRISRTYGVSVVEIRRIDGCEITVAGLDALDGSPIIDIKMAPR